MVPNDSTREPIDMGAGKRDVGDDEGRAIEADDSAQPILQDVRQAAHRQAVKDDGDWGGDEPRR